MRALFVEDQADLRELIGELLADEGLEVFSCASAEDAEARFDAAGADILFTDISLPGRSGVELARRLMARAPQLWVVFSSGYATGSALTALGPRVRSLTKPFELIELQALLAEIRAAAN